MLQILPMALVREDRSLVIVLSWAVVVEKWGCLLGVLGLLVGIGVS